MKAKHEESKMVKTKKSAKKTTKANPWSGEVIAENIQKNAERISENIRKNAEEISANITANAVRIAKNINAR